MIQIIKSYFSLMEGYKKHFYFSVVFAIIKGLFSIVQILALFFALKDVFTNSVSMNTMFACFVMVLVSVIGSGIFGAGSSVQKTICGYYGGAKARMKIAEFLQSVGLGYFNNRSLGYTSATATNAVQAIQEAGTTIVYCLMDGLISASIICITILCYNWKIGLAAVFGVILFFSTLSWMQKRAVRHTDEYSRVDSEVVSTVLEFIQGLPQIKSYNRDAVESDHTKENIQKHSDLMFRLETDFIPVAAVQKVIVGFTGVLVITASLYSTIVGDMEIYEMMGMMVSAWMMFMPLEAAGQYAFLLRQLGANEQKVQEIFELPILDEVSNDQKIKGVNIEFKDVSFAYDERPILKHVSFKIQEKTTTAFVGPSGSGKSTILSLLARFWDAGSGAITLDGDNIKDFTLDELMSKISVVFQDVYLFNDTIANNIRFGRPGASMEEVRRAARKACCDEFIEQLPQGYDTMVGEGGAKLSGGEKQRVSIARCLIKDAPIVLLDEATANVDPENEGKIQQAIESLLHEKTVVMIAHRLKTVRHADQIIVLEDGEVRQVGRHEDLCIVDGIYRDFLNVRKEAIDWKI